MKRDLGFERPYANSLDAVSNRDFALDYLSAAAICATHLSRLGGEIVLWSSQEFGFVELPDSFASGSSIMPQKKNPDAAELLRGKAPRVAASLQSLLGTMHALPLAYSKDLQEDKEPLFDAIDNLELCLAAATGMVVNFALNHALNFRFRQRSAARQFQTFCAVSGLGVVLTAGLSSALRALVEGLLGAQFPFLGARVDADFAGHFLAVGLVALYSYPAHRFLSFNIGIRARLRQARRLLSASRRPSPFAFRSEARFGND